MYCPICQKEHATLTIERKYGNTIYQGQVCPKCYVIAENYDYSTFHRVFIERRYKKCRYCGTTLEEIEHSLLVGCQRCYEEFKAELQPMIDRFQGKL